MITEVIMSTTLWLLGIILSPIQLVFQPLGSMAGLIELLSLASVFIPMGALATALLIWLAFYSLRFTIVVINWIIGKIPTIS